MTEAIIVAAIGAVGMVLAALMQSLRKENRTDHAMVSTALDRIETKLDGHINDHAAGVYSTSPTTRKVPANARKAHPKRSRMDKALPE